MKKILILLAFLITAPAFSQDPPEVFTSTQKVSFAVTKDGEIYKDGFTRYDKADVYSRNLKLVYPNSIIRVRGSEVEVDVNISKLNLNELTKKTKDSTYNITVISIIDATRFVGVFGNGEAFTISANDATNLQTGQTYSMNLRLSIDAYKEEEYIVKIDKL